MVFYSKFIGGGAKYMSATAFLMTGTGI